MGALKDFLTGKTKRKIATTKGLVKDVQALGRFKSGKGLKNRAESRRVHRASSRTGVSVEAYR